MQAVIWLPGVPRSIALMKIASFKSAARSSRVARRSRANIFSGERSQNDAVAVADLALSLLPGRHKVTTVVGSAREGDGGWLRRDSDS